MPVCGAVFLAVGASATGADWFGGVMTPAKPPETGASSGCQVGREVRTWRRAAWRAPSLSRIIQDSR